MIANYFTNTKIDDKLYLNQYRNQDDIAINFNHFHNKEKAQEIEQEYGRFVSHLKHKYGEVQHNYGSNNQYKSKCTKNKKPQEYLFLHHCYEIDIYCLSNKDVAKAFDCYELHDGKNLVGCNMFEHLYLHWLIQERNNTYNCGFSMIFGEMSDMFNDFVYQKQYYDERRAFYINKPLYQKQYEFFRTIDDRSRFVSDMLKNVVHMIVESIDFLGVDKVNKYYRTRIKPLLNIIEQLYDVNPINECLKGIISVNQLYIYYKCSRGVNYKGQGIVTMQRLLRYEEQLLIRCEKANVDLYNLKQYFKPFKPCKLMYQSE